MTKISAIELTGPREMRIIDDTLGPPGPGEATMQLRYSGISAGTEMNVYRGDAPMWRRQQDPKTRVFVDADAPEWTYPMRYGYMATGQVIALGEGVTELAEGDLIYAYVPPQTRVNVPVSRTIKLPDSADLRTAVLLANLNTSFNAVLDADLHLGENIVVFGLGVLGQLLTQWCRMAGVGQVIGVDLLPERRKMAEEVSGADVTLDPAAAGDLALALRAHTGDRGADLAFEVSGADRALNEAIRSVGLDGKVMVMSWYPGALSNVFPGAEFHHNRVRLICSQVGAVKPELSHRWTPERRSGVVVDLMSQLNLSPLATHNFSFENGTQAYATVDQGDPGLMLATIEYPT